MSEQQYYSDSVLVDEAHNLNVYNSSGINYSFVIKDIAIHNGWLLLRLQTDLYCNRKVNYHYWHLM